jgi:hypothetical protein
MVGIFEEQTPKSKAALHNGSAALLEFGRPAYEYAGPEENLSLGEP